MGLQGLLLNLLYLYSLILFARAMFSWIDPGMQSPIGRFLRQVTDPVVDPIRQVVPPVGGIDFSVMVAIFLVMIVQRLVAQLF